MIRTTIIMGIVKKMFVPARAIFFNSEGSRLPENGQGVDNRALENADARQVSEAAIIYKSNYRALMEQINKYADSNNPRFAAIATKYRDILSASLLDPSTVEVLQPKAQRENIRRITAVITQFSQEVSKASSAGQSKAEEPVEQGRGVNARAWLNEAVSEPSSAKVADSAENPETLEDAFKRYQLVYNANYAVINNWLEKAKQGNIMTANNENAADRLQQYSQSFKAQFGDLKKAMFKDAAGVDRVIAGMNDFMDKNVVPFYTDLTTNNRSKIMAQQSRAIPSNKS